MLIKKLVKILVIIATIDNIIQNKHTNIDKLITISIIFITNNFIQKSLKNIYGFNFYINNFISMFLSSLFGSYIVYNKIDYFILEFSIIRFLTFCLTNLIKNYSNFDYKISELISTSLISILEILILNKKYIYILSKYINFILNILL